MSKIKEINGEVVQRYLLEGEPLPYTLSIALIHHKSATVLSSVIDFDFVEEIKEDERFADLFAYVVERYLEVASDKFGKYIRENFEIFKGGDKDE